MFLKNYSGLGDKKLIEQLNGNVERQFFCGIYSGFSRLKNFKIVSDIRTELSQKLNIEKLENSPYQYWEPYIGEEEKVVVDATNENRKFVTKSQIKTDFKAEGKP